jgi:hypothetical protein
MVISDENNFLNYNFKPYSKSLQSIEQLDENEVISTFATTLEDLQRPGPLEMPVFSISQIFLFGNYFKTQWLESLQKRSRLTLKILNPTATTEWQIISEDTNFTPQNAYRFVEPLSNIF